MDKWSHPYSRHYLQLIPIQKWKIKCLQWNVPGYVNNTSGQAPCPGAVSQHRMNSKALCVGFCLTFFFCLFLLSFFFVDFEKEKRTERDYTYDIGG